jgi:hypothetical protein
VLAAFVLVLGGFFVLNRAVSPPGISQSERRLLAEMPELSARSFVSAEFMGGFENWAADSFVFRDGLRAVRAETVFHVFLQSDKDGLYFGGSGAGKIEKIQPEAWRRSAEKIRSLAAGLDGLNLYCAFVPDKSMYAGRPLPGFDPDEARRLFAEELPEIKFIDLAAALSGEDFYRTDLHWSQIRLAGVTDALAAGMDAPALAAGKPSAPLWAGDMRNPLPQAEDMQDAPAPAADIRLTGVTGLAAGIWQPGGEIHEAGSFLGVYAGQLALPLKPDTMSFVTNEAIDKVVVSCLDPRTGKMTAGSVYNPDALTDGGDPYDFFLNGPQPLIVLESPAAQAKGADSTGSVDNAGSTDSTGVDGTNGNSAADSAGSADDADAAGGTAAMRESGRELYLFRDSFGSSLAPLLTGAYSRITLIDLRYIDSRVLSDFVEFSPRADVLFLYSAQILNNPDALLVRP